MLKIMSKSCVGVRIMLTSARVISLHKSGFLLVRAQINGQSIFQSSLNDFMLLVPVEFEVLESDSVIESLVCMEQEFI